jgi:hypothetical protein
MICFAKPVLTEDLCIVQKEELSITCDKFGTYTWRKPSIFIRDKPIFWWERMLHKDYYCKGSVEKKKISGRESQGAWRQDEVIGGKPPVVK